MKRKRSKLLGLILTFVLIVSFAIGLTGCDFEILFEGEPGSGHEHQPVETIIEPTCLEGGYSEFNCSCGYDYKDKFVEALGHAEVVDKRVEPTCTETGLTEGKHCSRCEAVLIEQKVIPALGHAFDAAKVLISEDETSAVLQIDCHICGTFENVPYCGYYLSGRTAYQFDANGQRVDIVKSFVEIEGNTYYVINNLVVINYYVIDDTVYDFGEDGAMKPSVLDKQFINVEDKTYYVENNKVVKGLQIIEGKVYDFDIDGVMKDTLFNNQFVEIGANTYYAVNNIIVTNYYIIDGKVYDFGTDGAIKNTVFNNEFVEISGNTYYVINNVIVLNYYIIDGRVYDFGTDGAMKDTLFNNEFVEIGGNTYYVINNIIVLNYFIIDGKVYDFGTDGAMKDTLFNNEFVEINGNTYYVINNIIVLNYFIIDGRVYDFGTDGAMKNTVFNNEFVEISGNTYYVINNIIVLNYFIIEGTVYDFGTDGAMKNTVFNNEFVEIGGKTYYVVNNMVVTHYYIIEDKVYDFGTDGAMKDTLFNNEFVEIGGKTYYVINNIIVKNYFILDGRVYDFGADGAMKDTLFNNEFVEIGGKTYYVINNMVVTNYYIIDNKVYDFGTDGAMKDTLFNNEFVEIGGKTYYVINNIIVKNYFIIGGKVYDFGLDGVLQNTLLDHVIISIGQDKYYVVNNFVQVSIYVVKDRKIYYFFTDGKMLVSTNFDGYNFGADGAMTGSGIFITIDGILYEVTDGFADVHEHRYAKEVIAPTCLQDGYTQNTCPCGSEYKDNIVPALGHNWSENWQTVVAATCTEQGSELRHCLNDHEHTETRVTEALGHDYGTLIPLVKPTCQEVGKDEYYCCVRCEEIFNNKFEPTTNELLVLEKVYHNFVNNECSFCSILRTNVTGRVFKANSTTALTGVSIHIEGIDNKGLAFSADVTTNNSGEYMVENIPMGAYKASIVKTGYYQNDATIKVYYSGQVITNLYLVEIASTNLGKVSGKAVNAKDGLGISGLTIYVRKGTNNNNGEVITTLTTNADGTYTTAGLAEGNYTLQFVDERTGITTGNKFATNMISVAVIHDTTVSNQNITLTYAIPNGIRFVLTWNGTVSDLDSHLEFGSNGSGTHVYYSNKSQNGAMLDVDDTTYYGPETITISSINTNYKYRYYIYNYSKSGTFSNANAKIEVYMDDEMLFEIPAISGSGYYWSVLTYSASEGFRINNRVASSVVI